MDEIAAYSERKAQLQQSITLTAQGQRYVLGKRTSSNLFRYSSKDNTATARLNLSDFNHVLAVDSVAQTLDVEGLATFEQIVTATLSKGLLPRVAPELKHITIGGAIAGIGIESSCFRYGFVHDMLLSVEALLPDGRVVRCDDQNEYADLFHALPNSYGTLAYILRAKIKLVPAQPYVRIAIHRFKDTSALIDAMYAAAQGSKLDFCEALLFGPQRSYLMLGTFADRVVRIDDILHEHVFYKLVQERRTIWLRTYDYVFRYDPDWFWNLPESPFFNMLRRYAAARYRNSGFYYRYTDTLNRLRARVGLTGDRRTEPLIQDWEVPWPEALPFTEFALREVDLGGKPWLATPIRTAFSATLYPMALNTLYYNLGCYCHIPIRNDHERYWYSKIMDQQCFARGGIKMLYSSSFLSRERFGAHYNGAAYAQLKQKYDPDGRLPSLYEQCNLQS